MEVVVGLVEHLDLSVDEALTARLHGHFHRPEFGRRRTCRRDAGGGHLVDPAELEQHEDSEWPLARQQWRTLHLDASSSNTLSDKVPAQESVARYRGDDLTSSVKFAYRAAKDTEISGCLNLHLWVETEDADDADLFAAVCKTDAQGRRLYRVTVAG